MTIQDCIKLITAHNGWTFEGSFIQEHPTAPASIGGGGGLASAATSSVEVARPSTSTPVQFAGVLAPSRACKLATSTP